MVRYACNYKFTLEATDYNVLSPIFKNLLSTFLYHSKIHLSEDDEKGHGMKLNVFSTILDLNMRDLERNRKPEGYNRENGNRMIFPVRNKGEKIELHLLCCSKRDSGVESAIGRVLSREGIDYLVERINDYPKHDARDREHIPF